MTGCSSNALRWSPGWVRHRPGDRAGLARRARTSPSSTSTATPRPKPPRPSVSRWQGLQLQARRDRARALSKVAAQIGERSGKSQSWSTMPASTAATPSPRPRSGDQGLAGHPGGQPQRRVQRDTCFSRHSSARPRAGSSTSARSSRSFMCERRIRPPTPPRSTACSASPARLRRSSAKTACGSTPSARLDRDAAQEKVRATNPSW